MASLCGMQAGEVLQRRYRLIRLLGEGGMGRVYVAEDLRLPGKLWAVKETMPLFGDASGFLQEARLLAKLQHPLLPQIVDYYAPTETNGYAYVVMELIPGVTLDAALRDKHGRLNEETVVSIGRQLCDALVYLHGQRPEPVVFRDLKPGNIMVDERGRVKLIDFGIARRFKPRQSTDTVPLGTIGFAAPEQLRGEQTDPRSDLYSLGAVLYYLLSGETYAVGTTNRPLVELRPDTSELLRQLIERLLAPLPEERPKRAEEVLAAFRRLETMRTASAPGQRDHAWTAAAAERHERGAGNTPPAPRLKMIVVGGLYAGAGSTFAAFCLSYALQLAGVEHAVCEHPIVEPEHYALLGGERQAPRGYRCLSERMLAGDASYSPEWVDGHALFVPSHPDANEEGWSADGVGEWLRRIDRPVVVVDISDRWVDPTVKQLLSQADELLAVVDPSPSKLRRPRVRALLHNLDAAERGGASSVSWVANRDTPSKRRDDWLRMLPAPLAVSLPVFQAERMLDVHWAGGGVPLGAAERETVAGAFAAFVTHIVTDGQPVRRWRKAR